MFKKIALTAAAVATIVGAGVTANTNTADAGFRIHLHGGGYYGGYGYGYGGHYRPVYHGRRCYRKKRRIKVWSSAHGHWHTRWRRGRLICRY